MTSKHTWEQVESVLSVDGETEKQAQARTLAGLESRWSTGEPFSICWRRKPGDHTVSIVLTTPADAIAFPAGARSIPLEGNPPEEPLLDGHGRLMAARFSPSAEGAEGRQVAGRDSRDWVPQMLLETTVATTPETPFNISCVACPVVDGKLDKVAAALITAANTGTPHGFDKRVPLYRESGRHWWYVLIAVSSTNDALTSAICGALRSRCQPIELEDIDPEALSVARNGNLDLLSLESAIKVSGPSSEGVGKEGQFALTSEEAASVIPIPETEVPGVRLNRVSVFDVNQELPGPDGSRGNGVTIGEILTASGDPAGPVTVPDSTLNRHAFVCGATGSGKSETIRTLLSALADREPPTPWMVIEPAKAEYREMASRLASSKLTVIDPSLPAGGIPVALNPLEPEPGFRLDLHLELLKVLIVTAFDAEEPFPQILSQAISDCYSALGWQVERPPEKGRTYSRSWAPELPLWPTMVDLTEAAEQAVLEVEYGDEVQSNILGFVRVRLASLQTGVRGRFLVSGYPLAFKSLLDRNVVFEIENIGDDRDKAFVMGLIILRLFEALRPSARSDPGSKEGPTEEQPRGGLRHVLVVEEAHRLLSRNAAAQEQVETFANILSEIRAYGEGIIVAEQIPAKVIEDVIKNTALKVMHRLPAEDDRKAVGATMNLTEEQNRSAVAQIPGEAIVFADGMDRSIRTRMKKPPSHDADAPSNGLGVKTEIPPIARGLGPFCFCFGSCEQDRCSEQEIAAGRELLDFSTPEVGRALVDGRGVLDLTLRTACWLSATGELSDTALAEFRTFVAKDHRNRCAASQGLDSILRGVAKAPWFTGNSRDALVQALFADLAKCLSDGEVDEERAFWTTSEQGRSALAKNAAARGPRNWGSVLWLHFSFAENEEPSLAAFANSANQGAESLGRLTASIAADLASSAEWSPMWEEVMSEMRDLEQQAPEDDISSGDG